jgi:hypothetical protein
MSISNIVIFYLCSIVIYEVIQIVKYGNTGDSYLYIVLKIYDNVILIYLLIISNNSNNQQYKFCNITHLNILLKFITGCIYILSFFYYLLIYEFNEYKSIVFIEFINSIILPVIYVCYGCDKVNKISEDNIQIITINNVSHNENNIPIAQAVVI